MFLLKTLHLKNFGAISDSTFSPIQDGVTSIYGANGNGKSTFLDGLVWALFGAAPKDKKQIDIRNFSADDKEKTVVKVVFEHEGDTISVTRSMNKRGTVTAEVTLNDTEVTKITPSTAVAWVKRRLGISEESFTQAFAIRQKELDDLVSAKPTKRREIIERIFGVDKLSLALKYAKEAEKESRISFEQYRDVSQDIEEIEETIEHLTSSFGETERSLEELSIEADDLETHQAEALETWNTLSHDERAYRNAYKFIDSKNQEIEQIKNSISYSEKSLAELDVDESVNVESEYEELLTQQEDLRSKLKANSDVMDENTRVKAQTESRKNMLANELVTFFREKEEHESLISRAKEFLSQDAPYDDAELLREVQAVDSERESLLSVKSVLDNTVSTMADSISMLNGHDASCPTCHQDLKDPDALVSSFEKQKKDAETRLQENARKIQECVQKRTQLENNKRELDSFVGSQKRAEEQKEHAEKQVDTLDKRIAENEELLADLEKTLSDEDPNISLRAVQDSLTEEYDSVMKSLNNIENVKQSVNKMNSLHEEIVEGRKKIDALTEEVDDFRGEMPALVSSEEVEEAQNKYLAVKKKYESARESEQSEQQAYYSQRSTLDLKNADLRTLKAEDDKRTSARKLYEQRIATSRFISEFRKETISRIAPEISASASAVVSSMTSDEFVGINIDEEFTPSVIRADGREDPISFLSGGEKSLVALAMFLGIRDILSGGVGGFIWADEALVSQDANRRNLIASTLRNLPHVQLVMVNHTPDGNDLSDVVVELVKGEKGSFLKSD